MLQLVNSLWSLLRVVGPVEVHLQAKILIDL